MIYGSTLSARAAKSLDRLFAQEGSSEHSLFKYEPSHEISNNVVCVTSKGSDQPAHMRSLIRAFASPMNIL